ncbi:hypothetical protein E2C01_006158 [Portunus trituberculatus]|uniref:Uncharacterized protein n=1 Tax=Portunus trituberculatus TaxID=210409 RepID=A0A5B7D117_PORTR|nr:hypothetical protein [Portunus trituberculatus]
MRQGGEEAREEREGNVEVLLVGLPRWVFPLGRLWGGVVPRWVWEGRRSDYLELMVTNDLTSVAREIVNSLAPQTPTNDRLLLVITLTPTASPAPQVSLVLLLLELFLLILEGEEAKERR